MSLPTTFNQAASHRNLLCNIRTERQTDIAVDPAYQEEMLRYTLVIIPARNESQDVGTVVKSVRAIGLDVLVIDDYSDDDTASQAFFSGADVLTLSFHCGSWGAIQAGMRYALEQGYRYVITMDADGQHYANEIKALMGAYIDDGVNVIIGSCVDRANQRRKIAWKLLRFISGLKIEDLTSGFRLYDSSALRLLSEPKCTLIEYQDIPVLLFLRRYGLKIAEVSVAMQERCHGKSRIFRSWPVVAYYLTYSFLIGSTRRIDEKKIAVRGSRFLETDE